MNLRRIITLVLSLFVTISIIFLVYTEMKPAHTGPRESKSTEDAQSNLHPDFKDKNRSITVYYFHSSIRCPTCFKIENYTNEAIKENFKNQINDTIFWKPINTDKKENQHYTKDYKLFTKSVIIEERTGEKQLRWKNLDKIWELTGDREQFIDYIRKEIMKYMGSQ